MVRSWGVEGESRAATNVLADSGCQGKLGLETDSMNTHENNRRNEVVYAKARRAGMLIVCRKKSLGVFRTL